jgi:hypothetical protein
LNIQKYFKYFFYYLYDMKILISEKQLKGLFKSTDNQEIDEQDDPAAAQPESGTSSTQSGGQGYPEVGVWESGVGREGPGNQLGPTTWESIVGAKLTRGKANKLK